MASSPVSGTSNNNSDGVHHNGHIHREAHDDHFHPLPVRATHTVIHALRHGSHPPHHHEHGHTRKHLISRPSARQYFTADGDLHKVCDLGVPRAAGKFELFLDLLYIGLCANFAEDMIHHPTSGAHFIKYLLIFIPVWRIWMDLTVIMNQYFSDDLCQRLLIVWVMVLLLLFGNNAIYIDTSLNALRITAAAFMLARFSIALTNLVFSMTVTHHRFQLRFHSILTILILPIYTPLFFPTSGVSNAVKITTTIFGLSLDILIRYLTNSSLFRCFFNLPYTTAVDVDHHIDRMSAFFIIVLGEFLYGIVWASPAALSVDKFVRATLALIIAWELCWLYVAADGSPENKEAGVHALRWCGRNGAAWFVVHLPLSAALLIAGDICAAFVTHGGIAVLSESSPTTSGYGDAEKHTKRAATGGDSAFPQPADLKPLLWLFCGSLSIGILCLYLISLLHHEADEDKDTKDIFVLPMRIRRCMRVPCAIIIACLPLAFRGNTPGDGLTVTGVMAVCVALLAGVVGWEMVGGLDKKWTMVERKRGCCKLTGLEVDLAKGKVDLEEGITEGVGDVKHVENIEEKGDEVAEVLKMQEEAALKRIDTRRTRRGCQEVGEEERMVDTVNSEPKPGEKGCEKIQYVKGEGGCC